MLVPRKLLVHGVMIKVEEEEAGGAGIIRINIDSFYDREGHVKSASEPSSITSFFPNYIASRWRPGEPAWLHFELYTDWEDVTKMSSKERWLKPVAGARTRYRYSIAGEMFQLAGPGRDEDLYVDAGFPIALTIGLPPYPGKPTQVAPGQYVCIAKGDLFGALSQWAPNATTT